MSVILSLLLFSSAGEKLLVSAEVPTVSRPFQGWEWTLPLFTVHNAIVQASQ